MNAFATRNTRMTTVARCPVGCPVTVPLTTMNTVQQGRSGAAEGSKWDGTLPVSRDQLHTRAEASRSRSGGCHE
jgi:hypothetical protein